MLKKLEEHRNNSKEGFSALKKVIEYSCSRCGLCVSLCPSQSIEMQKTIPTLVGECNKCGICYQGCPRSFYPESAINKRWFGKGKTLIEKRVGVHVDRFTTRSLNNTIFEGATNGGATTELLSYLLEKKIIDAVLHLESIHKDSFICHHARTLISTQPEDVLKGQHSKQHITPMLHDLDKMSPYKNFAVVGLPCHVHAVRKLQLIKDDPAFRKVFPDLAKRSDKLVGNLKFMISINCFMNPKHEGLDKVYKHYGIKEQDVIKFAETAKPGLYQLLNEGKDYMWFASDEIMTKDGQTYNFRYGKFLDETLDMGCPLCMSSIVSKEADISIGVTASELKMNEYGYNSIFVRNAELYVILKNMIHEGRLLKRPMWENKGNHIRRILEPLLPQKDVLNFQGYVKTGKWKPIKNIYDKTESGYTGIIMGTQRLFMMQTIKKNVFLNPARKALELANKFTTDIF